MNFLVVDVLTLEDRIGPLGPLGQPLSL